MAGKIQDCREVVKGTHVVGDDGGVAQTSRSELRVVMDVVVLKMLPLFIDVVRRDGGSPQTLQRPPGVPAGLVMGRMRLLRLRDQGSERGYEGQLHRTERGRR